MMGNFVEYIKKYRVIIDETSSDGCLTVGDTTFDKLPLIRRVVFESTPGENSYIVTELLMPENWNGIFLGIGNGGMGGAMTFEYILSYAVKGYAVAQTDIGTSRGWESGVDNPDVWKDYGWRATQVMTVVSKELIEEHYGKAPDFSYFKGASTGGQQAMCLAQRFPDCYDGIIAGTPANNRACLHTFFLWNLVHLRTSDGRILFTKEQTEAITECAVDFFKKLGTAGENDNYITYPYDGENTTDMFLNFLKEKYPEYTDEQISALRAVYNGPVNPKTGKQILCGIPIGAESYFSYYADVNFHDIYLFRWVFGKKFDPYKFDFDKDLETFKKKLSPDTDVNSLDLSEFYYNGGKLIAYAGTEDPLVPYPEFYNYYNLVCENMGGIDVVSKFFRFYLMPGKDHKIDGRGINAWWADEEQSELLNALRKWREEGEEPDYIVGARMEGANVKFMKRLYAYDGNKKEVVSFPKCCDNEYLKF